MDIAIDLCKYMNERYKYLHGLFRAQASLLYNNFEESEATDFY